VSEIQQASLNIYDIAGRKTETLLNSTTLDPGKYKFTFNNVIPGIYFAEFTSLNGKAVVKIVRVE
jgi:hypothetical protein